MTDNFWDGAEIIHSYSRKQAIEDGVLVDVSEMAREAGIKFPVALTRAVWADCVELTDVLKKNAPDQDENGRLWDVLWMFRDSARRSGGSEIFFRVAVRRHYRNDKGLELVTLKAICGPGDTPEPVITILLPDED